MPKPGQFAHKDWGTKPAWNKGRYTVDQSECGPNEKKCKWIETDVCKKRNGIHPKDDFWKLSGNSTSPDGLMAACKYCTSARYRPIRRKARKRYYHRKQKSNGPNRRQGFRIIHCPEGLFTEGSEFSIRDFETSLHGDNKQEEGVWPDGMIVMEIGSEEYYKVIGNRLKEVDYESVRKQIG